MKVYLDASIYLDLLDRSRQNSPHSIAWYRGNKNIPAWDFYFSGDFILHFITHDKKLLEIKTLNTVKFCDQK